MQASGGEKRRDQGLEKGASGQQPQQSQSEPQTTIRRRAELVVVPVTVKDDQGKLVTDLRQDELRIFEDTIEQKIDVFTNEAFPISAVVLVDNELTTKLADQVEKSLPAIAGGFSEHDEVAVARFDVRLHRAGDFTDNNDQLLSQLQRVNLDSEFPGGPPGGPLSSGPTINGKPAPGTESIPRRAAGITRKASKDIDDAVYEAGEMLQQRPRERRKIIVLISDGNNSKNNTHSFNDTVKLLLTSGISVYSVGVGNANFDRGLTVSSKYAHATGGDVFYGLKRETIENLYSVLTEQARNQYTLAYVPRGTDRALEYHTIEVRVQRPHLSLVTREGYYSSGR
ncbi:MAG TPA: VWA domain-containing protein [Candidatus Dormibacteraeota bacterium]|nr:VWA domain-containing protein [Candidatus Dormibacteraeota bacterium]